MGRSPWAETAQTQAAFHENFSPDPGVTPTRAIYHPLAEQLTAVRVKAHAADKREMKLSP